MAKRKHPTCYCCCCCCRQEESPDETNHFDDESHIESLKNRNQSANPSSKEEGPKTWKQVSLEILKFMFSHIGLGVLVVAYSVMGGFLFQWLEQPFEQRVRGHMGDLRQAYVRELWAVGDKYNYLDKENWTKDAGLLIKEFQDKVVSAISNDGWDGSDDTNTDSKWNIANSLLYCMTLITTIGYGNNPPRTESGRIATIIYALFGIPLTLLFLTNIGSFLGDVFRLAYGVISDTIRYIFCCKCIFGSGTSTANQKPANSTGDKQTLENELDIMEPDEEASSQQNINKTINHDVSNNASGNVSNEQINSKSNPGLNEGVQKAESAHFELQGGKGNSRDNDSVHNVVSRQLEPSKSRGLQSTLSNMKSFKVRKKKRKIRVPLTVSVSALLFYILMGASIFTVWENQWDFTIAGYFVFVTLTTIGLGDFVFGTGEDEDNGKLIFGTLYLVIGLAMIAMCFDLMQEEVRYKFKILGKKLGLT